MTPDFTWISHPASICVLLGNIALLLYIFTARRKRSQ